MLFGVAMIFEVSFLLEALEFFFLLLLFIRYVCGDYLNSLLIILLYSCVGGWRDIRHLTSHMIVTLPRFLTMLASKNCLKCINIISIDFEEDHEVSASTFYIAINRAKLKVEG